MAMVYILFAVVFVGMIVLFTKSSNLSKRVSSLTEQRDDFVIKYNQSTGEVTNLQKILFGISERFDELNTRVTSLQGEVQMLRADNESLQSEVNRLSRSNQRKDILLRAVQPQSS